MDGTAADRIERFLAEHPGVLLTVAVGYASPAGIAWLARRTRNRTVRLLIGHCQRHRFARSSSEDRADVLGFLDRPDVTVCNWYRRRGEASEAHLKVWIAHDVPRPAALNGSANLTNQGLYHNVEVVTGVPDDELDAVVRMVEELFDKAWDRKGKLREFMDPVADSESSGSGRVESAPPHAYTTPSSAVSMGSGRSGGCARVGKGCLSAVVAVVLVAVLIGLLSRGCSSRPEPTTPIPTQSASPTTNPATSGAATVSAVSPTAAGASATITQPGGAFDVEEPAVVLMPLALAYVDAMNSFHQALDGLVRDINTVSDVWDTQAESSRSYSETEAALISVVEQTRSLADRVRRQRVPIEIRGMHGEPGGPRRLASELADLAERVLAGLQVPAPDDGSERRSALQAFNQVADDFQTSISRVLTYIDEAARTNGLLTVGGQTTTTKALPQVELVEEAVAYVEGLSRFRDKLDEIVSDANAVNEAWDNRAETGATYSGTEDALVAIAERATAFYEQVQDHPIPRPVRFSEKDPRTTPAQ